MYNGVLGPLFRKKEDRNTELRKGVKFQGEKTLRISEIIVINLQEKPQIF